VTDGGRCWSVGRASKAAVAGPGDVREGAYGRATDLAARAGGGRRWPVGDSRDECCII